MIGEPNSQKMDKKLSQNPLRIIGSLLDTQSHQRAAVCSRTLLEALTSASAAWPPVLVIANSHHLRLGRSHRHMSSHLVRELDVCDGKCPSITDMECKCALDPLTKAIIVRSPNLTRLVFRHVEHHGKRSFSAAIVGSGLLTTSMFTRTLELYFHKQVLGALEVTGPWSAGPWELRLHGNPDGAWNLDHEFISIKTTGADIVWPLTVTDVTEHLDLNMSTISVLPNLRGGNRLKTIVLRDCRLHPKLGLFASIAGFVAGLQYFPKLESATIEFTNMPPAAIGSILNFYQRYLPTYALHVHLTTSPKSSEFKELLAELNDYRDIPKKSGARWTSPGGGSITLNGDAATCITIACS